MKSSIVITNWNGRKLLEKNLLSVLASKPDEIIVIDDASLDDSVSFIKKNYPKIRVIQNRKNLGFAKSCNKAVEQACGDIVALLNNDVVPEPGFLEKTIKHFEDPKVFAVSFNEPQWSWARICWQNGFIEHEPGEKTNETHITAWASGGSSAYRKAIWDKLGGFDDLYQPFYWEDIDVSYRAWKRGFKVLWEPKAIVHHKHEGTIGKHFSKRYIDYVSERNRLLFIWKNIVDKKMFSEHKKNLLKRLKKPAYLKILFSVLLKTPEIKRKRSFEEKESVVSDREIFDLFS